MMLKSIAATGMKTIINGTVDLKKALGGAD